MKKLLITLVIISLNSLVHCLEDQDSIVFKKLFQQKRMEHLSAVKQLLSLDQEKQEKLVNTMIEKIMSVLKSAKVQLEGSGFVPGASAIFPQNEETKNNLALVMENTCFFGDVFLRFPDLFHKKLKENKEWSLIYKWSLTFITESGFLDENTEKLVDLVSQEMGLKAKDPKYVNPYRQERKKQKRFEDPPPPKKKEKKKLKRGPRLSRTDEL